MKHFFRSKGMLLSCFIVVLLFNRCLYVGALMMSIEERKTIDTWKSEKYKTRIQRRAGWAGPYYYHCRVKERKMGGLYYHKIVSNTFSANDYAKCILKYPVHRRDTLSIDVCKKKVLFSKH